MAQGSCLYRLDARLKVASLVVLLAGVVSLRSPALLLWAVGGTLTLLVLARVPPSYVGKQLLAALPFTGFLVFVVFTTPGIPLFTVAGATISREGAVLAAVLGLRLLAALLLANVFTATTSSNEILRALAWFRVPGMFLAVAVFTLRYFSLFEDELARMRRAQRARSWRQGAIWHPANLRPLAALMGMAFLRALERAERVHRAMRARNYQPERGVTYDTSGDPGHESDLSLP